PVAVSAIEPEPRARSLRLGLGQVVAGVPGLQAETRYNPAQGDRIVMRGFGARAQFGVRGVLVRVDGIPATMPDGQSTLNHLDLSELARAEVVRGPASMLYGNAAGGAVLLETARPPFTGGGGRFSVTTGSAGLLRLGAAAEAAADPLDWRVAVTRERLDGFREFSWSESWNVTGASRVAVTGGDLVLSTHLVEYDARNPGGLTAEQLATDPTQAQERNVVQQTGEVGRHGQLGAVWTRSFDDVAIEASGHVLRRALDNPIPPVIIDLDRQAGGARLLARSQGAAGTRWAIGTEGSGQWDDRSNFDNQAGRRGTRVLDQAETVTNLAAFGQLLVPLGDPVELFAAARWDRIRFTAEDRLITADDPDDSGGRTLSAFSPSLGLTAEVARAVSLFANVSTSFQTPTTTELVNRPDGGGGFNPDLDPERTVGYEVGGRLRRQRGSISLAAELVGYRATVSDALVPFEVPAAPGRSYFRNASESLHTGLEAAVTAVTSATRATLALTLTRAEFVEYSVDQRAYDGLLVPGVRPWTVEVLLSRDLGREFRLSVDWRATGDMHADDANTLSDSGRPLVTGYQRTSVALAAPAFELGPLRLSPCGGVENLLDEPYSASVIVNAFGGRYFEPAPGRVVYVGLRSEL
ncbi:MAG: TonB-dependent receptor family protein, partial [Gemmatimonadota bacterium]